MTTRRHFLLPLALLISGAAAAAQTATAEYGANAPFPGVENMQRAHQNWVLDCQGCHGADALSHRNTVPQMAGEVARFLSVPGGRDYLARVPGVAASPLGDAELAELLNWVLVHFDPDHMPKDFKPYTADEMARLRSQPLRSGATKERNKLIAEFPDD